MENIKLSANEIKVLKLIDENACDGILFIEIFKKTKIDEKELKNILKKLEDINFIEYRRFKDGINDYDIENEGKRFLDNL